MKLCIKELREAKGLTQSELADLLNVSFQTVSKWENGVNYPDITQIPRLAEIFGVSSDIILGLVPLRKEEIIKYDEVDYWNEHRDVVKAWKELYWNEDYFRFFVKEVLKFENPVDMLDFGCGYGFLGMKFLPLLPFGSSYSGIDLDKGQINEATEFFDKTEYKYEFFNENVYDFKSDKKYDLVVALFLLSYFPRTEELISKMKSCLKPGGKILLIDVNMEVEQAGYYSGIEKTGYIRPDFVPMWEDELAKGERDYKMGTKLPFLLKEAGFGDIQARISDMVLIYEPADKNKKRMNDVFKYVYSQDDVFGNGLSYYLNHGCSLQKANDVLDYCKRTGEYFDKEDSMAVKTSGVYFVYATL